MIGFPLQLPIEASTKRSYRVEDGIKEIYGEDGKLIMHGRAITLSIRLTADEAIAVRAWITGIPVAVPVEE